MQLIPAIDLLDGRCVRLLHGKFEQVTYYDKAPAELARLYQDQGAQWLHVVDLAASRDGKEADTTALFKLLGDAGQDVQTGGGVRNSDDVRQRLDAGAKRVVIGSVCARETDRFIRWLHQFGADRLVAALDIRFDAHGIPRPRIYGWTEDATLDLWDLLTILVAEGLQHALITDIGRDGAMAGPNQELYQEIMQRYPGLQLQASGGVSTIADLSELARTKAAGAIVGKALLEGAFTVSEAVAELAP